MNISSFTKGLAAGMAIGSAAVMFTGPVSEKQKHKLQKKTESAFRDIGGMIDAVLDMVK